MELHNVSIGDKFKTGAHTTAVVVDFQDVRSLSTGQHVKHICIAQSAGLATNTFEVPFSTVVRNRI